MRFNAGDTPADCGKAPRPTYSILYAGCLAEGQTSIQHLQILRDLGHRVVSIDSGSAHIMRAEIKVLRRVRRRPFGPTNRADANGLILSAAYDQPFDILWIDKGLKISPRTPREVKGIQPGYRIVGYSPDDTTLRHNTPRRFRARGAFMLAERSAEHTKRVKEGHEAEYYEAKMSCTVGPGSILNTRKSEFV